MTWTIVIPCRVGSRGVLGKNYAMLGGKPLVCHAVDAALADERVGRVVVWTNDPVVKGIVEARYGSERVEVHGRDARTDSSEFTVDELTRLWAQEDDGPFAVLQPTLVPAGFFLPIAISYAENESPGWWAVTAPVEGLVWANGELLVPRINRQWQASLLTREAGLRLVTYPFEVQDYQPLHMDIPEDQWVDIDTPADLERARHVLQKPLRIIFNLIADEERGYGHLYRCLELASELQSHAVEFTGDLDARARAIVQSRGWSGANADLEYGAWCDVMVVDRLDTTRMQMAEWGRKAKKVVTFENLGEGARVADVVVNDMYWGSYGYQGFDWAILRPEFRGLGEFVVREKVGRVLVTFGGTDPGRLTELAAKHLWDWTEEEDIELRIVPPPGREIERSGVYPWVDNPVMATEMARADLVVCSAGRTLLEAIAVGVPTLVVAQNQREAMHGAITKAGWYLGQAGMVSGEDLANAAIRLMDWELRKRLAKYSRSLIDGRGVERAARLIVDLGSGFVR